MIDTLRNLLEDEIAWLMARTRVRRSWASDCGYYEEIIPDEQCLARAKDVRAKMEGIQSHV